MFKIAFAFIKRDSAIWLAYRWAAVLDLFSIFISGATFYFLSKLTDFSKTPALAPYGGDYFAFVLLGLAFSTYQGVGLNSFSQSLRGEQFMGTLEAILITPVSLSRFLVCSALWDFLYATLQTLVYIAFGVLVFGFPLSHANYFTAGLVLIASLLAFSSLGIVSAAFILRFKRGSPVTVFVGAFSDLLGGVFFPLSVLPPYLLSAAHFIPMSHALEGLRMCLLRNAGLQTVFPHLCYLLLFSAVLLPLGIFAFRRALHAAQREGSLGHY